jgi:hypothetical protein
MSIGSAKYLDWEQIRQLHAAVSRQPVPGVMQHVIGLPTPISLVKEPWRTESVPRQNFQLCFPQVAAPGRVPDKSKLL